VLVFAHQKNRLKIKDIKQLTMCSAHQKTSNDLLEKNKRMKRQQEKPSANKVAIFYCSVMSAILSKSFAACLSGRQVLIRRGGFGTFYQVAHPYSSVKRKIFTHCSQL
jgi:hypothetical protein